MPDVSTSLPNQARAQDGVDERAATAKLRRHKRKSAEIEPAAPTISITASAHAGMQDAPRCACFSQETTPAPHGGVLLSLCVNARLSQSQG